MFLTALMFVVAIALSAIAAFYSIVGLAAIFAAAVMPIVIMGTVLEVAKLTVTVWLHEYWRECRFIMKLYLVPAVVVLMIITSMGIFGFLSKAHIEQAVPAGDVAAQVQLLDERIANERETITNARNLLRQLDDAVMGIQSGSGREIKNRDGSVTVENPAERALQVRRSQARDRATLTATIEQAQRRIVEIQEQRAPIAGQLREVEAKVGPIKYIAALVYGDDPDKNLLERAVRWVIIVLVVVFDPLAIMMLLAATESHKWHKDRRRREEENDVIDDDVVPAVVPTDNQPHADLDAALPRTDEFEKDSRSNPDQDLTAQKPDQPPAAIDNIDPPHETQSNTNDPDDVDDDPDPSSVASQCKRLWKQDHPDMTLKEQRRLVAAGRLDHEPWLDYVDDPRIQRSMGHGDELPTTAHKGDMFVLVSVVPTQLYKHNGERWIPTDKNLTDQYAHDSGYIEFLINRIGNGSYDPDLLTEAERAQISQQLAREF